MSSKNIVYLCYGHLGVFYECAYSLLSLSRLYNNDELAQVHVWVYTDKPDWFAQFADIPVQLHFRKVDMPTVRQWRGSIDFVHRVKVEVLKDFTAANQGLVLYSDTDTVFLYNIDRMWASIATGKHYMHVMEGIVSEEPNPVMRKLHALLRNNFDGGPFPGDLTHKQMWNAGVLGFRSSDKALLNEVLSFTDSVYPRFPKHIVEQFAFSLRLQRDAPILAAAPYILHYWNLKEARVILESFFEYYKGEPWATLVQNAAQIQMHVLMQEKVNFYSNRSVMGKIQKQLWRPVVPKWEEISRMG